MKKVRSSFLCIILLLACRVPLHAGTIDTASVLQDLFTGLKSLKNMQYDFVSKISFPNGDTDRVAGNFIMDNDHQYVYKNCDAYTFLCDGHWLYKADHRKKTVLIVDLDKKANKEARNEVMKEIYQNSTFDSFADSVVMKKAIIKSYKKDGSVITLGLSVKHKQNTAKMNIVYDGKLQIPVKYNITMLIPSGRNAGKKTQDIKISMDCFDFEKLQQHTLVPMKDFFEFRKGALKLARYSTYKLYDKL